MNYINRSYSMSTFPGAILYGGDYNPEQWLEDIWRDDMRLMKVANVTMVTINVFSWALLEPAPDHYQFEQCPGEDVDRDHCHIRHFHQAHIIAPYIFKPLFGIIVAAVENGAGKCGHRVTPVDIVHRLGRASRRASCNACSTSAEMRARICAAHASSQRPCSSS